MNSKKRKQLAIERAIMNEVKKNHSENPIIQLKVTNSYAQKTFVNGKLYQNPVIASHLPNDSLASMRMPIITMSIEQLAKRKYIQGTTGRYVQFNSEFTKREVRYKFEKLGGFVKSVKLVQMKNDNIDTSKNYFEFFNMDKLTIADIEKLSNTDIQGLVTFLVLGNSHNSQKTQVNYRKLACIKKRFKSSKGYSLENLRFLNLMIGIAYTKYVKARIRFLNNCAKQCHIF